jgi:hypothetical protein
MTVGRKDQTLGIRGNTAEHRDEQCHGHTKTTIHTTG